MAITRDALITQALRVVGDTALTSRGEEWINNLLYEIESLGFWKFLSTTSTQATSNLVNSYAEPATYSKGMTIHITDTEVLEQVSYKTILEMRKLSETGSPRFFAMHGGNIEVYPTPVTGTLPTLQLDFYKNITVFTVDADVETTTGIPEKWHRYLHDGLISEGFQYVNDQRELSQRQRWEQDLIIMARENADYTKFQENKFDKDSLISRPEAGS